MMQWVKLLVPTDAAGNVTSTEYDALGRVDKVVQTARDVALNTTLDPFVDGETISVTPTVETFYNVHGEVLKTVQSGSAEARGKTRELSYMVDFHGNVIRSTDAIGHQVFMDYDAKGQVIETRESVDKYESESYKPIIRYEEEWDAEHKVYIRTPKYGEIQTLETPESYKFTRINQYQYDANGQQIQNSINTFDENGVESFITNVTGYNSFGEISNQGLLGAENTFEYKYDLAGRLVESNYQDGVVKNYTYDLRGKQTREFVDGDTNKTSDDRYSYIEYDLNGNAVIREGIEFTAFENTAESSTGSIQAPILKQNYDRWGNVTRVEKADGTFTEYLYDHFNQLVEEEKAAASYYDEEGNLVSSSYRAVTQHHFDERGLRVAEQDSLGNYTQFGYDEAGQLVSKTDRNNYTEEYAYDVHGQQIFSKDNLGHVRSTRYDLNGNITSQGIVRTNGFAEYTSGSGGTDSLIEKGLYRFEYDELGQRFKEFKIHGIGAGATESLVNQYKYDTRGNVLLNTEGDKYRNEYQYDEHGNKVLHKDGSGRELIWKYDEYGKLIQSVNLDEKVTDYKYDDHGQLESESIEYEDGTAGRNYEYYNNGLLKSITDFRLNGSRGDAFDGSERTDDYVLIEDRDYYEYDINGRQTLSLTTQSYEKCQQRRRSTNYHRLG